MNATDAHIEIARIDRKTYEEIKANGKFVPGYMVDGVFVPPLDTSVDSVVDAITPERSPVHASTSKLAHATTKERLTKIESIIENMVTQHAALVGNL